MKKLDEIPKTDFFEVPEGYFDRLPLKIQARLEKPERSRWTPFRSFSLRYALPVIAVMVGLLYFFRPKSAGTEEILAGIANEHLIAFLHESDLSENDLLEVVNFDELDVDSLDQHLSAPILGDTDEMELKSVLENEL